MKFLNYEGLGHLIEELKQRFVQQQAGKGLSANDFTDILKEKLDGIESGAEVNKVLSVNAKEGEVVITSDDIEFLSSVSGATSTTIRAIIDEIIAKNKAQDTEIAKKADKATTYTKTQVDSAIAPKADKDYVDEELGKKANQATTYTKDEVDQAVQVKSDKTYVDEELGKKADKSTTYTKTQVDSALKPKANKTYVDEELAKKADKATTYTKSEIDGKLGEIDSGVISVNEKTGVVTLTTDDISDEDNKNKFVTEQEKTTWTNKANVAYVDAEVAKKVDKVTGKGLSTHDFTTALKNKLDAIEAGSQKNVIELIQKNGTNLLIKDKTVNIEVPTQLGQLTNDRNYQTKAEIQSLIADQGKLKKEIVPNLPAVVSADDNTMYLIRNEQDTGYEEWMIINGQWEILGDTAAVDFTGWVHEDDIKTISNAEINAFLNK